MSRVSKILFFLFAFLGGIFIISIPSQEQAPVTFKSLTPNLMVEDMDATLSYYLKVLGFELLMSAPEQKPFDWAMVRREDVKLMFQTRKSLSDELPAFKEMPIGASLTFYTDVNHIEELYEQLKGKAEIEKDLYDTFYGTKEFVLRDCNGYRIVFAGEQQK